MGLSNRITRRSALSFCRVRAIADRGHPKKFVLVIIRVQRLRVRESNATQSVLPVWGRPVLALGDSLRRLQKRFVLGKSSDSE